MRIVSKLLHANLSVWRVLGFVVSNFLGLAIICAGVQVYADLRGLWQGDDSVVSSGYMVLNKRVTASTMLGDSPSAFSADEIADLRAQPWVRRVGEFTATDYEVLASMAPGGRGMSTMLFFEAVPDSFVDVSAADWHFEPGQTEVPVIIARDYLALYNFGFASSAGLPKISEQVMSGLPVGLRLRGDGGRELRLTARVVGYSDRLNTVLVPESFMTWSNSVLGGSAGSGNSPATQSGHPGAPGATRLIVDVSKPGDVAIASYLDSHGLEAAGDQGASRASYLLRVGAATVVGVGAVITVLSLFIVLLSMSLLLEKNRSVINQLLSLGYPFGTVSRPYLRVVLAASLCSLGLAVGAVALLRLTYLPVLDGMSLHGAGLWPTLAAGAAVTLLTLGVNALSVRRKVAAAWR